VYDVHETTPVTRAELHLAVGLGEQRVVATMADIVARVKMRATLTHDNRAGTDRRAVEDLHAEALGVRVTAVAGGTPAFGL
jgi:hypothetical protein